VPLNIISALASVYGALRSFLFMGNLFYDFPYNEITKEVLSTVQEGTTN
jgi:hypothetical protein